METKTNRPTPDAGILTSSILRWKRIAIVASAIAGLWHFASAAAGLSDPNFMARDLYQTYADLVFTILLAIGVFQLAWAAVTWKTNQRFLLILGVLVNILSILLYVVSLGVSLPPGIPVQPLNPVPVTVKVVEVVCVLAIFRVLSPAKP